MGFVPFLPLCLYLLPIYFLGTVYEAENMKTNKNYAIKILNPVGYKLLSSALLRRFTVVTKGKTVVDKSTDPLTIDNVWWLVNTSTKQFVAACFSDKSGLKELSLTQCIQIWGADPAIYARAMKENSNANTPPVIPSKFHEFLVKRALVFREIQNMRKISDHKNVIRLEYVLELNQDTKSTIFLVMELANGGELFDRIKVDCGTREETARVFFKQLLDGVRHCHEQGVCHRDLKPENLLLSDNGPGGSIMGTILKIADFGFSARIAMDNYDGALLQQQTMDCMTDTTTPLKQKTSSKGSLTTESPLRMLKSIVGSPFYVAPEVVQAAHGYDGVKADVWSIGVILYAMLAGNLPFLQELSTCKRFKSFVKWISDSTENASGNFWEESSTEYPSWLFPSKFSNEAKGLIVMMLHPDPTKRFTIIEAQKHCWVSGVTNPTAVPVVPVLSVTNAKGGDTANVAVEVIREEIAVNIDGFPVVAVYGSENNVETIEKVEEGNDVVEVDLIAATLLRDELQDHDSNMSASNVSPVSMSMPIDESCGYAVDLDHVNSVDMRDEGMHCCLDTVTEEDEFFAMDVDVGEEFDHCRMNSVASVEDVPASTWVDREGEVALEESSSTQLKRRLDANEYQCHPCPSDAMKVKSSSMMIPGMGNTNNIPISSSNSNSSANSSGHAAIDHTPSSPMRINSSPVYTYGSSYSDAIVTGNDLQSMYNNEEKYDDVATDLMAHSCPEPPIAPLLFNDDTKVDDLLNASGVVAGIGQPEDEDTDSITNSPSQHAHSNRNNTQMDIEMSGSVAPPSFSHLVKRSTRFVTSVAAMDVINKVECLLEKCRIKEVATPIGVIGRIHVNRKMYLLEVWGDDDTVGYPLCALQLYQLPRDHQNQKECESLLTKLMIASTPPHKTHFPNMNPTLYLVEFIRGELDIFMFKKFYQWVRKQLLTDLVNNMKDYTVNNYIDAV